jgi:hypothetical protein
MNDDVLWQCNETELLWMARHQGLGHLRRGLPKQELVSIVAGHMEPQPQHFSETRVSRDQLQQFLERNWGVVRSQLPGCTGKCLNFSCSEGKHSMCFNGVRDQVHL